MLRDPLIRVAPRCISRVSFADADERGRANGFGAGRRGRHARGRGERGCQHVSPTRSNSAQEVRWLVHLLGDLHQPLHVTTGYYDTNAAAFAKPKRIDAPAKAAVGGVLGDRRGNGLLFSASESNNLHALWDKCLPGMVAGATTLRNQGGPIEHLCDPAFTYSKNPMVPGDVAGDERDKAHGD